MSNKLTYQRQFPSENFKPKTNMRSVSITDDLGQVIFVQKDIEAPEQWSDLAVKVVASKYFYGKKGSDMRETSIIKLIHRVCNTIALHGVKTGYFDESSGKAFYDDLFWLCVNQFATFNSPVWFNVGLFHEYGVGKQARGTWRQAIEGAAMNPGAHEGELPQRCESQYEWPQSSACFINSVEDNMESLLELAKTEAMLFKFGSGTGTNLSPIRSSRETLSGGGTPSGPLSFLKIYDQVANVVKSGGKCLAPDQLVYTHRGPVPVKELADSGQNFVVLSYDPPAGRIKFKWATAWASGQKRVLSIKTDKGEFHLSEDHPVKLADGRFVQARHLKIGQALFAMTVKRLSKNYDYGSIKLAPWTKDRELVHRLIASDILGHDIQGRVVHHVDEDTSNNYPDNLELLECQNDHALLHAEQLLGSGLHTFQLHKFSHIGHNNGMHRSSDFFKDKDKVEDWKKKLGEQSVRYAAKAQDEAATQRMLNNAWELINHGFNIDTFEGYNAAMNTHFSHGTSSDVRLHRIKTRFGSYSNFLNQLSVLNHRVVDISHVDYMPVYSVEVQCPTTDDKTPESGHNFAICPYGCEGFGSMIFVSNTRRAAKMNILDCTHPDIEEFIEAKGNEERKAHALIEQGYDPSFNGEAYGSVMYQNENLSVRVTDEFMKLATSEGDATYQTKFVVSEGGETKDAKALLRKVADGTWICGDPGMQFIGAIDKWHTCSATDSIHATNPCSEFVFLDNTACNLASINLLKFLKVDGTFNMSMFTNTVNLFIIAQEILVGLSSYPTPTIARNSVNYRPLGLGYANLGALLMSLGVPYDSDEARSITGAITSLMTSTAYLMSAMLANAVGPFCGFEKNKEPMTKVMELHQQHAHLLVENFHSPTFYDVAKVASDTWDAALNAGQHGTGWRNSQVSVLAPTGTISFMMDCDTTGIEPDIALVKFKLLAGGGNFTYTNKSVSRALTRLGYKEDEIKAIIAHIEKHNTIESVPGHPTLLLEKHLPVFDCAFKPKLGQRFIHHNAHIDIMAAAQPFLSGAISKTINMPEHSTVDDIIGAYTRAWKEGLKCVAIYRDGSKRSQPLTSSARTDETSSSLKKQLEEVKEELEERKEEIVDLWRQVAEGGKPSRLKLSETRSALTHKFSIAGVEGYITVGMFEDGSPGELFITMSKEGSTVGGLMDCIGTLTSIALQYGVPLQDLVNKFSHVRFEPSGWTTNEKVRNASSVVDYIFRWMATQFTVQEERSDEVEKLKSVQVSFVEATTVDQPKEIEVDGRQLDAPMCGNCGHVTVRSGSCYLCHNCGTTSGCS